MPTHKQLYTQFGHICISIYLKSTQNEMLPKSVKLGQRWLFTGVCDLESDPDRQNRWACMQEKINDQISAE